MEITNDIRYIGVDDHAIDLFESQYAVENGMAYNSYVLIDDKTAVFDTVDADFGCEWLEKLESELGGRTPDYLIIQHMEPDHSSNIAVFMEKYTEAVIVASKKAFAMMKQFFGTDYPERQLTVKQGQTLELGRHTLTFIEAPMVHWPEVIMTYDSYDKVLFSADAFGKFGANDVEDPEGWACEARRYYFGIVGKYGVQVQNLLKKAAALDIRIICSTHGPVLTENIGYYIDLYNTWSSYKPEDKGVTIAYASVYGNTREAVGRLADMLEANGVTVSVHDLSRDDFYEAVEDAFRYDRLVLAATTYNMDIFPAMKHFIDALTERNYQDRTIALIENGSWAPAAAKIMAEKFSKSKNIRMAQTKVCIRSALNDESMAALRALSAELSAM